MTLANPTPDKRWKTNQLKPSGRGFLPRHPFTHGASHRSLGVWPPIKSLTLKGIHYLQAMFIQINDWNNLPNSGVPSEELAAPRAPLARSLPASRHFCFQANISSSAFSTSSSQGCRAKALPIPQFNSFPDIPSLFPRQHCHTHPHSSPGAEPGSQPPWPHFPRTTQTTSGPKQDVPRLHFRFIPKGPNSLPVRDNILEVGLSLE